MIKRCHDFVPSVILFSFMLFIFAPFEIYLSNKGYFFFEGSEMIGYSLLAFTLSSLFCLILLTVASAINQGLYRLGYGAFIGGAIALYLQGNWDITDYGAWNGSEIDWNGFRTQAIFFACIFVLLIVSCAIISIKKYDLINNRYKINIFSIPWDNDS